MKVILNGACGKMGVQVRRLLEQGDKGCCLAAGVDPAASPEDPLAVKALKDFTGEADVIIDFSSHLCTKELTEYAIRRALPCVIATTGHDERETGLIKSAAEKIPIFFAANMSIGVAMLAEFAARAALLMPGADIEIVEKHHNRKLDAPSGTALMLADEIMSVRKNAHTIFGRSGHAKREPEEIAIHSLRLGDIIGEHEVIINDGSETVTLKHEAHSRSLFAQGALTAAEFISKKPAGLYTMRSLIDEKKLFT